MPKFHLFIVEGPHDSEFVARLLGYRGLRRVQQQGHVNPYWDNLIPKKYPAEGDLLRRHPVPLFLQNAEHAVAINVAVGESKILSKLEAALKLLDVSQLHSIGIVLDADTIESPADRVRRLNSEWDNPDLIFPAVPGTVTAGMPRSGVFVLPDNTGQGILEDVLLRCAQLNYPTLLGSAKRHVEEFVRSPAEATAEDLNEIHRTSGQKKAIVASIVALLRPGRAVQVSIQDNRWLTDTALTLPEVASAISFLDALLAP